MFNIKKYDKDFILIVSVIGALSVVALAMAYGIYRLSFKNEDYSAEILSQANDLASRIHDNRYGGKPKYYIYVDDVPDVPIYPPVSGRVSSNFGWRKTFGRMHYGTDIAADYGNPIYAAMDGIVTYANWNGGLHRGYGLLIEIEHAPGLRTRYGHCSAIMVRPGEHVKKGEYIGQVGSTGHSTGPHLHFEIRVNGNPIDPAKYIIRGTEE